MNLKKKLIVPNDRDQAKMLTEIGNKKFFSTPKQRIDDQGRMKTLVSNKKQNLIIESNTKQQLDKQLKLLTPTTQKSFLYLVNYAIQRGYIDEFSIDINEFLEVQGMIRRTNNIDRIYNGLHVLTDGSFECETFIYSKGKDGERKKIRRSFRSKSPLLAYVRHEKSGRKTTGIKVRLGDWFAHYKEARQSDDVFLLTLPLECLKVDTKHFPYSFGVPYRMAQYARVNSKKNQEWYILSLKEAIEGVEPWEEAEKKIKMYGFNHKQALIERLTLSLEHAEKPFGLFWEWINQEPQTIAEARQAKIRFRFSEPLKKSG